MIKANELRLGNMLIFDNHISPAKEVVVNARFFSSLANGRTTEDLKFDEIITSYYRPIQITPEILVKCGFEKDNDGVYALGMPDSNLSFYFIGFIQLAVKYTPIMNFTKCVHLHELQNLYYALTGEELEISL